MGFGLFVPEFRTEFAMSTAMVGLVSSLAFLGFLLGLLIAQALLERRGPKGPVLTGLALATLGMGLVASAPGVWMLALGVTFAAKSAGLVWTPFNEAIHSGVAEAERATALSVVSTGTAVGVALAGVAALVMLVGDLSWRVSWAIFGLASFAAGVANWVVFRGAADGGRRGPVGQWRKALAVRSAIPLFATGFAYGTTSAIYIAFAADHAVASGGVEAVPLQAIPALIFICYGLAGLTGLLAGRARALIGLPALVRLLLLAGAASLALVALVPDRLAWLVLSAALQGVHVMMISATLSFWSERLFPDLPSLSFTAALVTAAVGSVLGPVTVGMVADAAGAELALAGAALVPVIVVVALRTHVIRDAPAAEA